MFHKNIKASYKIHSVNSLRYVRVSRADELTTAVTTILWYLQWIKPFTTSPAALRRNFASYKCISIILISHSSTVMTVSSLCRRTNGDIRSPELRLRQQRRP